MEPWGIWSVTRSKTHERQQWAAVAPDYPSDPKTLQVFSSRMLAGHRILLLSNSCPRSFFLFHQSSSRWILLCKFVIHQQSDVVKVHVFETWQSPTDLDCTGQVLQLGKSAQWFHQFPHTLVRDEYGLFAPRATEENLPCLLETAAG